jgi:hypothetical protein
MKAEKREKIAKIIVEATVAGDKATCQKYGISSRTLQRWRKGIEPEDDTTLAASVGAKKAILEAQWAEEIPGALKSSIEFLRKAGEQADPKSPDAIHSVAGALKLLSEVAMSWKLLDARISRQARQARETDSASAAGARAGGASRGDGKPGDTERPSLN